MIARLGIVVCGLVLVLTACTQVASQVATQPTTGGGAPAIVQPASSTAPADLGPTPADEPVQFSVSLHLPGEAALNAYLAGLSRPGSPSFQQYLTPEQFGARFGLPDRDVQRVTRWLTDAGFAITTTPQRTSISVQGRAGQVAPLLGVTLTDRITASGVRYHVPVGQPQFPHSVRDAVEVVTGLDTEPVQQSMFGHIYMSGVPEPGLTPASVASAYEISPLHQAGFHGEGMEIAIVSFDTFTPADFPKWDQQMGISGAPEVTRVALPGAVDEPGGGAGEVALDVEVIRGIAPKAHITNYEGPNTSNGFVPIIARIVADGKAKIISNSWGTCENRNGRDEMAAEERELAAAFAAGISFFGASGDDGAFDCRRIHISNNPFERDISAGVDWPAASTSIIAVGGTFLTIREDGTYFEEAGWEEPLSGGGTGGGLSRFQQRPSWQQAPGVDNAQSNGNRQVPDVAGPADPSSGFFVLFTDPEQGQVSGRVGGTSAAAPFWAASMLLTQQFAASQGITQLGPLGPVLYQVATQNPTVFHDVIKGGNLLYHAGPGWDYATGLGSPRVAPLAQAIVALLQQ